MTRATWFTAAAALCAAVPMAAFQRATFTSRAEAVRVDVSATERGRPVGGLTAGDFEVLDNGVPQQVELVATEEIPLDLVMALDVSGSVTGERLQHLRAASSLALGTLRKDDKAALLAFSHAVAISAPLTSDRSRVRGALDIPPSPGYTSLVDAVFAALVQADAGSGRGLAIVFSDGLDTASWLRAEDVAETATRLDAVLFGVATGTRHAGVLDDLAEATGGDLISLTSTRELSAAFERLVQQFRQRYLLSYVPRGVQPGGWHKLTVRSKRRGVSVKARAGYFGS